jgi:hypothetical protein
MANGLRISRRRMTQRAQQKLKRRKTKSGSKRILDQAVGCMRWLGSFLVVQNHCLLHNQHCHNARFTLIPEYRINSYF